MAFYYGNDIGDAARSEERALERALNLALANRSFLSNERSRSDAIAAQNAAARQNAYSQALALEQADRANRLNTSLALQDRAYQRDQTDIQRRLGLSEAEKGRALQRELFGARQDQYQQRLDATEADRTYRDIAKRIGSNDIPDIPALQEAEGGRLGSDEWLDLKGRLGQHQARLRAEEEIGPQQAAAEATATLNGDMSFSAATTPAMKQAAMLRVMRDLEASRVYAGKLRPNLETFTFEPRLEYKYTTGRDAIDWYNPNPRSSLPAIRPDLDYGGAVGDSGPDLSSRVGAPEPAYAPPPVSIQQPASAPDPRAEEVRALVAQGVPREQAIAIVAQKYNRPRSTRAF